MKATISSFSFWWFVFFWGILCLAQAWWTPIHLDEAYYWCYSQELDWGYFDHPPMVAIWIKISSFFSSGILGVRLLTILTLIASFYLIYQLLEPQKETSFPKQLAFWGIVFCLPLFHIYGFITTPDVPLLFFGVLFFTFYKQVLEDGKWSDFLLWGIIMGLLLWSKYHAALLILFILISNPKLFLRPQTYVAGALGLLIWSPHLYWQYEHDWMSFNYHLSERAHNSKWFHPLEFIGNALLIFNPFFIGFFIQVLKKRWQNDFERGLYFTLFGFIFFFALQTLRDHVQPQWLVLTYIPFVILLLNNFEIRQWNYLKKAFWVILPILILAHVFLSVDLLPKDLDIFRKEALAQKIKKETGEKPVVFINSYRKAAMYRWYTGEYAHSYNTADNRKNQFNIWQTDTIFNKKEVFIYGMGKANNALDNKKTTIQNYLSYDKVKIKIISSTQIEIENPYAYPLTFSDENLQLYLVLFKAKKILKQDAVPLKEQLVIPSNTSTTVHLDLSTYSFENADSYGFGVKKTPWKVSSVYYKNTIPLGQ